MRAKKTLQAVLPAIILAITPFISHAVVEYNPATEEEDIIFIPTVKEKNMGLRIHRQVLEKFDLPVDPLMQKRIERIGAKLAGGSDRRNMVYHFTVIDHEKDDFYNAFAAPGGYIYIFSDMVEVLETDGKIAAVLAHEMGHVEAKHSIKRLQGSIGMTALILLGSQMKKEKDTMRDASDAVGHLMSAYSRHAEEQADELSVRYLKRAGYDPANAVAALETLKKLRKKAPRMKYMVYRSHPYLSERIAALDKHIKGHADFDTYINITFEEDIF